MRAQGRSGAETEEQEAFQSAERASDDDDAARLYDRVLALNPARADAYLRRAAIDYRRKKFADAATRLKKGHAELPDDLGITAQLGIALYNDGGTDEGVKLMEGVVAKKYALAYQVEPLLGEHYLRTGDGPRAVSAFEGYFRSRPDDVGAATDAQLYAYAGGAYLLTKDWPAAEKQLDQAVKVNPDDRLSRVKLATAYMGERAYGKAQAAFERLLPYASKQPSIYYDLAGCDVQLGKRAEAAKYAESYTLARPADARGFVLLGQARALGREYGKALAAFTEALRLDGRNGAALAGLGRVYIAQRNYPEAIRRLEAALAASPSHAGEVAILTPLAEAYAIARTGETQLLSDVATRLEKETNDVEAITASGVAWFAAGDDAAAERTFTAALALDAEGRRPRVGLAATLDREASKRVAATPGATVGEGQLGEAERLLTRATELDSSSLECARNLGLVLVLEKKWGEAERRLAAVVRRAPGDALTLRLLARAQAGGGKIDDALAQLEAARPLAQGDMATLLPQLLAETGALLLQKGAIDRAVDVLDGAVKALATRGDRDDSRLSIVARRDLALALYRRGAGGIDEARGARGGDAHEEAGSLDDLTRALELGRAGALAPKELLQATCAVAVAALRAGKLATSEDALGKAAKLGGCPFAAPWDRLGADYLGAWREYRDTQSPARREQAAKTFAKLLTKTGAATGNGVAEQLRALVRSSYELEGYDWWVRGDGRKAEAAERLAAKVELRSEDRVLEHNLAVCDLEAGHLAPAEKAFEAMGQKPPEALVNLGIVRDRQGDGKRALDLYKRAWDRGVRAGKLREWIDVKERILSGGGGR